jgi:hypothetical protein
MTNDGEMSMDHDQIHKQLIESFFREFMLLFFPALARLIDFSRVEFLREEHFTDVNAGLRRRLDLVVKVGLKTGGEKFVLVHTEFEASRKEADLPRRMFRYFCQLFLRYDTEIVPIAMFTDDAVWKTRVPEQFELSLPGRTFVRFEYHVIKLKNLDYREFLESENPLAYALMAKMNYNRKERVRLKADFLRLILGCRVDPARQSLLVEYVETYLPLTSDEETEFRQIVTSGRKYVEVEQMITVYEKRGIEKGIEKGRQEALILLLEKKFGKLSAAQRRKIRQIESPEKLQPLLLAVLDANSLEDLPF